MFVFEYVRWLWAHWYTPMSVATVALMVAWAVTPVPRTNDR